MTKLLFCYYMDHEGDKMARMETRDDYCIPLNIFASDESDFDLKEESYCDIDICGFSSEIEVYDSEDEYRKANPRMDIMSVIPTGIFPLDEEDEPFFIQNPNILFSGIVTEANRICDDDQFNYELLVRTLDMELNLAVRHDGNIRPGDIVTGFTWLCADIKADQSLS